LALPDPARPPFSSSNDRVQGSSAQFLACLRHGLSPLPFDIIALALLPFVLLLVNDSWTFVSPAGWVDAYLYTGYMTDLKHYLGDFGPTYYGSRLPWLLYGSAIHSLFSYDTANLVLRFSLFYGGTFPLYVIMRALWQNRLAATVSALVLATHPSFLGAISWDYPDGVCIVLMLLTVMCLTLACRARPWPLLLALAGFLATTTLSNQLFLVLLLPPIAGSWFLLINWRWGKRPLSQSVAWGAAGACAAFIAYGLANMHLVGRFDYLRPQIEARHLDGYAYGTRGWAWLNHAGWLAFPTLGVAISLALLLLAAWRWFRGRSLGAVTAPDYAGACAGLIMLETTVVLVGFQLLRGPILQFVFYASYFIPFVFLAVGAAIASGLSQIPRRWWLPVVGLVAMIQLAPLKHDDLLSVPRFIGLDSVTHFNSNGRALLLIAGGTLLVVSTVARRAPLGLLALVALSLAGVLFSDERMLLGSNRGTAKSLSQMVRDATVVIDRFNPNGDVRYWYDSIADPLSGVFRGIASTHLYQYRLVSENFPLLTFPGRDQPSELVPGETIAILSSSDRALQAATAAASQVGLDVLHSQTVRRGKDAFNLIIVRVTLRDLRPAAEIPLSALKPYEPVCAQISRDKDGGVDLKVDHAQRCYGAVAVLPPPSEPDRHPAYIRALVKISTGVVGIGVSRTTGEFIDLVRLVGTGDVRGTRQVYLRIPDLRDAYYFVVRNGEGRVPARLNIQSLTLYLPDAAGQ
jgi:hypothetical protein